MMRAPDALPLHLMLMMMQSGISPSAWSASSNPFAALLPRWMQPKSPLEQSMDAWQSQWQQSSDQLSALLSQWLSPSEKPKSSRHSRAGGNPERSATSSPHPSWPEIPAFAGMTDFFAALSTQATEQSAAFMQGMQSYLSADYEPPRMDYPVLWQRGSARLLDLAPEATDALAVLCVPSLINTARVLDLTHEHSFVRYLKAQGLRPLILDWGSPDAAELQFSTADYINAYALDALSQLREQHDGPIALAGYCMGGIFSVAMAQLAPMFVDALVLLATPWDFSAEDTPRVLLEPASQAMFRQWIGSMNPVPPLVTQTLFHLIDPWRIQQKYARYPLLDEAERAHFLAVEHWVNDGVPLAQAVAQECLVDWPQANILHRHQWKVGRRWIEPASITCPTLAVIPQNDLIVPQGCALPLTKQIKRCQVMMPDAGHVSMVCGRRAKEVMWQPVVQWLNAKFSQ